ncbi:uncharacterized protein P174DRAFT_76959 [Aspergillus novofumigatus IBT 16806]|uniref:Uncharacterized protein n=1 Tax=Aspergillus novofumigatus (strain IBT 16806) TaxID=1392255 RepID=A0A2I1CFE2_ASPN1|nr:uncharacterized protein P174DRAFT_76959 [Aspergillus novofumigatus IBT 16806]PKX96342.1 hypothetical protein P174DRAFT_76959 [Aspergillus novofumigatus IBT 16806]
MLERRLEEMQNNISAEYEHPAATVHMSRYMCIWGRASLSIRDLNVLANLIDIWNLSSIPWHHLRYGNSIRVTLRCSASSC